jgi:hypothetical protein
MRVDFVKTNIPAEVEGSKKRQKSGFLKNWKILDCEPTSAAGELKKEEKVRIYFKKKTNMAPLAPLAL